MKKPGKADEGYQVGRGKPPKEHMWKKGDPSPNPKGRPPKKVPRDYAELVDKVFEERVAVTINGRKKLLSLREFTALNLARMAAEGNLQAVRAIGLVRGFGPIGSGEDEDSKVLRIRLKLEEDPRERDTIDEEDEL